jgi:hypothetical protein
MFRNTISSMGEEKDKNLIDFIAATVETMRDQMATKDDLARVESSVASVESRIDQVESSVHRVEFNLASVKDQMATKNDVARVESWLDVKTTAIRGDIERVQLRLDSIDHALSGRMSLIEGQISRLRSVVYLLVKDQPDMLSLLGQSQPGESRPQG